MSSILPYSRRGTLLRRSQQQRASELTVAAKKASASRERANSLHPDIQLGATGLFLLVSGGDVVNSAIQQMMDVAAKKPAAARE